MIKETKVSGSLPQEIYEKLTNTKAKICLDDTDVALCVNGKEGIVIEGLQAEETTKEFLESFFAKLASMEQVKQSTHFLLYVTSANSVQMEEMEVIGRFVNSLDQDLELKWGLCVKEGNVKTGIIAVCMH